ncbi:MAG: hypothetical protein A3B16_02570 [Candidatus Zambryskibacteria bacterium RIFCSPLOWO2_01_FULL_45_43]|uniref:Uncharacterized protein n=1 Tax=Candidatus Zambryskibacteria bacterium RIFCSPLOWO2_01_FULL_45_43 TaxID=1802762 RepID=A0A1G2U8M6_9BACT|nr:MAG: hypothetical protein A3B16_02570 [Candidatus Zambryskibacteria bacterium RIFCSPLOWO2_01_FULL_45_43]
MDRKSKKAPEKFGGFTLCFGWAGWDQTTDLPALVLLRQWWLSRLTIPGSVCHCDTSDLPPRAGGVLMHNEGGAALPLSYGPPKHGVFLNN